MKSLIAKTIIILILVTIFGGTVWQTINSIQDRDITTAVNQLDNSEFVAEIRVVIRDVAEDVIRDLINDGAVTIITP